MQNRASAKDGSKDGSISISEHTMHPEKELGSEPTVESRPPSGSISKPFYHPLKATDIMMQFELQVKEVAEFDSRITALEEIQRELVTTVNRILAIKEEKDGTLQKILTAQQEVMAMMLMQMQQPPPQPQSQSGQMTWMPMQQQPLPQPQPQPQPGQHTEGNDTRRH